MKSAKFIRGVTGTSDILLDGKFQVAFIGRSNVGKSTLINSLAMKKGLARSSSHPGKTVRMDFFLINNLFYFVDFPGYGFAARSWEIRNKLAKMILWYIMYSEIKNRLVILVIDAKVGITAFDQDMLKTLREYNVNHLIVANKIDNVPSNQKAAQLAKIESESGNAKVLPYSSKQTYGREEIMKQITAYF